MGWPVREHWRYTSTRYRRFLRIKFSQIGRNDLLCRFRRCSTFRPVTFGARIDGAMARYGTRYRRFAKTKFGENGRNDLLGRFGPCSTFRHKTFGSGSDSGMACLRALEVYFNMVPSVPENNVWLKRTKRPLRPVSALFDVSA